MAVMYFKNSETGAFEPLSVGGGGSSVALDTTLTASGKSADAKATGDRFALYQRMLEQATNAMQEDNAAQDAEIDGLKETIDDVEGRVTALEQEGANAYASPLTVDADIAQDYGLATTSILGEETAADPQSAYGVSAALAAVIDQARTAWMTEYGGDYRKIPIIVSTDQHARRNSGIFNMVGSVVNMHDVSKVMNLGDTVSGEWLDADTEHPLLTNATLDAWMDSIKAIPFSKRLDVFGNHDTWYGNWDDEGNPIGTRYPSSQAHLYQYFRNIYPRRMNSNGWFVSYDAAFNVKYVVISGYEYKGGYSTTRIGTAQMNFIIDEFSKDDGYDIVVVSHEPLWQVPASNIYPTAAQSGGSETLYSLAKIDTVSLFNARKNRTSGTVTDSDGVAHSFDFSNCTTDILCGLHGHMHYDAYNFVGGVDDGLMNFSFDWFSDNTFFFALLDRVNAQLNIWKVEGTALAVTNFKVPFDKANVPVEPDEPDEPEKTLTGISATYSGGDVAVGTALTALAGVVVTATYSDGSTETVTGYTLSGEIKEGSNTITVSYGGMTATFTVTGVAAEEPGGDSEITNPYVTNGLTLWLDGIYNTAEGHADTLSAWEDLIGGREFVNTGATVTNNAVVFDGASNCLYASAVAAPVTIEIVLEPGAESGSAVITGFGNNAAGNISYFRSSGEIIEKRGNYSSSGANAQSTESGCHGYTFIDGVTQYRDGVEQPVTSKNSSWTGTGAMCIGQQWTNAGVNAQYAYEGKIMCIRHYNRQLTAAEIAQNAAADRARFGITVTA